MKTTINIIIVSALMAVATSATAKSWRINNNAAAAPDFASINEAMNNTNVTAGDTLYLDPGIVINGNQTVSKQVTIVGPGYNRSDSPNAFAYLQNDLYITAAYTKVEGIVMLNNDIHIRAEHVTIERCKFIGIEIADDRYSAQHSAIRQCYGERVYGETYYGAIVNESFHCTIENCILLREGNCIESLLSPIIKHNYIRSSRYSNITPFYNLEYPTIVDNIVINTYNGSNIFNQITNIVSVSHNVFSGDENANYPDNRYGSNTEANVFTLTGLNDQRYQLKKGSPAIGYASEENGGGDCGPYGGLTPYVPGGLPNGYPYYTKAIIPAKSKNGKVNVSLKIKMQNE